MLTPNKIKLDLSAISGTIQGKIKDAPEPINHRQSQDDFLTILPEQKVGIATIKKGIYVEIHILKLGDDDISGSKNPKQILDEVSKKSVATMYVSEKSKGESNSFIFDKRTGSPAVNAAHEFYREKIASNLDSANDDNPLFFRKALALLNSQNLIDNSYIPSPENIKSISLKQNPLKPPTRMDILQSEELVQVGDEKGIKLSFKIMESWNGGNSLREVEDRKKTPRGTIETTIRLSNAWTKQSIIESYIEAIEFAAVRSINYNNNLDTFSLSEGVDSEFKTNLDTVLKMRNLKLPTQWKASFSKNRLKETTENDIPLIYFADAIQQLGIAEVVDEGSGGGLQTVYRFKSNQTTASEKVKFCSHQETSQAIDRINAGEDTKFIPNRGLSVSRGNAVKGGKKFITHLMNEGVISDPDAYNKCLKLVKAQTKGQDFSAINKAGKSAGVYYAPHYKNSVQKATHSIVDEIFSWRKVSDKVKSRLLDSNILGTAWFIKFGKPRPCLVVNLVKGIDDKHVSQQELYIDKSKQKHKLQKPFYKNGDRDGTAAVMKPKSGTNRGIIFTEAFVDMCSAYDVLDKLGHNPDEYTFASALSSTSLHSWLAASSGGYRPATERETKFHPDTHVYKDIVHETEILDYEDKVKKVRSILEPMSPLNFHDDGSETSKAALNRLQKLVKTVNKNLQGDEIPLDIAVTQRKGFKDSYHHPNSKTNEDGDYVLDASNTDNFLRNSGIIFNAADKVERMVDFKSESVPVTDPSELARARADIVKNLGTDRLIAYHDTDVPGLKSMPAFGEFLKALKLQGNVLTLPFVSEHDARMNTRDVSDHLIRHCHELIDYKLDAPINDINDLSKFVQTTTSDSDAFKECAQAISNSLKNNYGDADEKRLSEALDVLPLLDDAISKTPLSVKTFSPSPKHEEPSLSSRATMRT